MKGGSVIARLVVNLEAIRHNARLVQQLCSSRGMWLTAVTKGVLGDPVIVRHVISAGVDTLGDSRLRNILRMRTAGIRAEFHLIRAPSPAPRLPGLRVVAASSDHLILDATAAESTVYVGQEIPFRLNYGALPRHPESLREKRVRGCGRCTTLLRPVQAEGPGRPFGGRVADGEGTGAGCGPHGSRHRERLAEARDR